LLKGSTLSLPCVDAREARVPGQFSIGE